MASSLISVLISRLSWLREISTRVKFHNKSVWFAVVKAEPPPGLVVGTPGFISRRLQIESSWRLNKFTEFTQFREDDWEAPISSRLRSWRLQEFRCPNHNYPTVMPCISRACRGVCWTKLPMALLLQIGEKIKIKINKEKYSTKLSVLNNGFS